MTPLTRQDLITRPFSLSSGNDGVRRHPMMTLSSCVNGASEIGRMRRSQVADKEKGKSQNCQRLTKLLLKVNIKNSLGPVPVVMSPEDTVHDLIKVVIETYAKQRRRPLLNGTDPRFFDLHYSPFNLESLKPEEKLMNLGSRNFFLCPKDYNAASSSSSSSSDEKKTTKLSFAFVRLMDFLL